MQKIQRKLWVGGLIVLSSLSLLCCTAPAQADTAIYVDPVNGNEKNTGVAPNQETMMCTSAGGMQSGKSEPN